MSSWFKMAIEDDPELTLTDTLSVQLPMKTISS